ncbi:IclR family transcriptional regulator [Pseudophaeobacter leonis]|uniref:IclR family transcriptional regulator n=1 Tax=Pseudophaeobacter leonis TaxID=1144477 RepID=UPI001F4EA706|nr:IclR family transcriptional regulator C-terminal domain-containing protein [Pseudophaeobacter leonis]
MLSLTPRVLARAGGFLQANEFGRRVQPVLNRHARKLDTEINRAILDQGRVLLLAQSTTERGPVTYGFTAGAHIPLVHTSLGRMLLACLPQQEATELLRSADIPQHTEQSLIAENAILKQIAQARSQGYAVTDSEFEPGIIGYAVPLSRPGQTPVVVGSSSPRGLGGMGDLGELGGQGDPGGTPAGEHAERLLRGLQVCAASCARPRLSPAFDTGLLIRAFGTGRTRGVFKKTRRKLSPLCRLERRKARRIVPFEQPIMRALDIQAPNV